MHNRDAEDRPVNCSVGVGRSIMANRLSYFLNIHGPSVTIDTACSGSLVGLDMACRTIQSRETDAAIIATSNLYLHPDHVIDRGSVGQTHSPTALCHTFDQDADGYVKSEAVSCIIIKRLTDAIRHRDPIRAIIRGTATNRCVHSPSGPLILPLTFRKHLTEYELIVATEEPQALRVRALQPRRQRYDQLTATQALPTSTIQHISSATVRVHRQATLPRSAVWVLFLENRALRKSPLSLVP